MCGTDKCPEVVGLEVSAIDKVAIELPAGGEVDRDGENEQRNCQVATQARHQPRLSQNVIDFRWPRPQQRREQHQQQGARGLEQ